MIDDNHLIYNRKGTFLTDKGYLIGLRMRLWYLSKVNSKEFPAGYKMSWIVFNLATEKERILFDNHIGKPHHYHENGKEKFLEWVSLEETEKLFWKLVYQKFGYFNYE